MLVIFLLLFIGVPLIEIYFLIQIGGEIGAFTTILLILATAVGGGVVIKSQGLKVLGQLQQQLNSGRSPALSLWHSLLLAIAGVLLLTPGFITDTLGALLLFPTFRVWLLHTLIRRWLQNKFSRTVNIIEGEFKILDK